MQFGQSPFTSRRLDPVEGIVVSRRSLGLVKVHGLRPGDSRIGRQRGRKLPGRTAGRDRQDEAIDAHQRHRPVVHQSEAVRAGQARRNAATSAGPDAVAIAAGVVGVGPKVLWWESQHDQDVLSRVGGTRFPWAEVGGGAGHARRGQAHDQSEPKLPHQTGHQEDPPGSSG